MASKDANANSADAPPAVVAPKLFARLDSYQTESEFVVSVMSKNLKTEDVSVEFGTENFRVRAKLPDGTNFDKEIRCSKKIDPDNCSFKVMSAKVVIRLRKFESGLWPALETEKAVTKGTKSESNITNVRLDFKPSYPSSSTKRHDWDEVEKELKKEEDSELYEDNNSLFAKIYNSSDENTKRAMIKSMQESNGTVLSTNWEEVGKKAVDVTPPDGMEYRKW